MSVRDRGRAGRRGGAGRRSDHETRDACGPRSPYAWLLATLAGMLEFIPLVGPLTSGGIILLASWLAGYQHLAWILLFLIVWRMVQDYVQEYYAPAIRGEAAGDDPPTG